MVSLRKFVELNVKSKILEIKVPLKLTFYFLILIHLLTFRYNKGLNFWILLKVFFNLEIWKIAQTRCISGYFGKYCRARCVYPYYGDECEAQCNCSEPMCDATIGCKAVDEGNIQMSTNRTKSFYCCLKNIAMNFCSKKVYLLMLFLLRCTFLKTLIIVVMCHLND